MCVVLSISARTAFCTILCDSFFIPSQIPHKWGKGHVLSLPEFEKQNLSSVFGRKYFCTKMSERAGIRHWQGVNVLFTAGYKTAKMTVL